MTTGLSPKEAPKGKEEDVKEQLWEIASRHQVLVVGGCIIACFLIATAILTCFQSVRDFCRDQFGMQTDAEVRLMNLAEIDLAPPPKGR